jgi:hypothetical protein
MNEPNVSLFFELIRSAIWNKPADESLFRDIDSSVWEEILSYAESHKVTALLYDGVLTLPELMRPEKTTVYKLFFHADAIEQLNVRNTQVLKELSDVYEKMGISFVLLKGHGNALCYPNPKRRPPGDIDFFFYREDDYRNANKWAERQGCDMHTESIHHQSFEYKKVHIENHKQVSYFQIRRYDRLLESEVQKIIEEDNFLQLDIEGIKVKILPLEFNVFFIFQHLFHHFIHLGIGMKQFCDWTLFWNKFSLQIDKEKFIRLAESFDLLNAMKVFASAAVKYLGAKPSIFPFETDIDGKYVDLVMEDILNGGNFGFSIFKNRTFSSRIHRKWFSFKYTTGRIRKIAAIAPQHIRTLPIIKINKNLKLLFKK